MTSVSFLPEWAPQSAVLLAWPHEETDWADMLDEVHACFSEIIRTISMYEKVLLVVPDEFRAESLAKEFGENVATIVVQTNDTWARDFGPLSIIENGNPVCLDFKFNGWGLKFAANRDNLINKKLFDHDVFAEGVIYQNRLNFVLEGGALETDGLGTLLTTTECLLSPNRNGQYSQDEIENYLKSTLGLQKILWLHNGYLAGDDTDSHIDTLARFCSPDTIAYVQISDKSDEHYLALSKMEAELQAFTKSDGKSYNLIPLPMADTVEFDGVRLPATYANFLIINGAVLVPVYNSPKDEIALKQIATAFPDRKTIGINCIPLIKQHGSLHCVTMQIPEGFVKPVNSDQ